MGQVKSGSFTGDGSISVLLDIGFEPDALIIETDLDYTQTTWGGIYLVAFVKNKVAFNLMKATTDTNVSQYANVIAENAAPYGADGSGSYRSYGTYSNGSFSVSNKTNNYRVYFINGQSYRWMAIKK